MAGACVRSCRTCAGSQKLRCKNGCSKVKARERSKGAGGPFNSNAPELQVWVPSRGMAGASKLAGGLLLVAADLRDHLAQRHL